MADDEIFWFGVVVVGLGVLVLASKWAFIREVFFVQCPPTISVEAPMGPMADRLVQDFFLHKVDVEEQPMQLYTTKAE